MSKESRRARGVAHAAYKLQREIKFKARKEAKDEYRKGWTNSQKRVAQAIAAMKAYYGEDFHEGYYVSGELIDIYDKVYVENKEFPELNQEEIDEVNEIMRKSGSNKFLRPVKEDVSFTSADAILKAIQEAGGI